MRSTEDDNCQGCVGTKCSFTHFRPITTARLQVVAEKCGVHSWGDNKFIDFFVSWVGTRPSLGMR